MSCCPLFSTDAAETPGINSNHPQPTSNLGQKNFPVPKPFKEQLSRREVNPRPAEPPPPGPTPPPSSAPMRVCRPRPPSPQPPPPPPLRWPKCLGGVAVGAAAGHPPGLGSDRSVEVLWGGGGLGRIHGLEVVSGGVASDGRPSDRRTDEGTAVCGLRRPPRTARGSPPDDRWRWSAEVPGCGAVMAPSPECPRRFGWSIRTASAMEGGGTPQTFVRRGLVVLDYNARGIGGGLGGGGGGLSFGGGGGV